MKWPSLFRTKTSRPRSEAQVLAELRQSLKYFGFPTDHFSDEDLKKGITTLASFATKSGITTSEFSKALTTLSSRIGV